MHLADHVQQDPQKWRCELGVVEGSVGSDRMHRWTHGHVGALRKDLDDPSKETIAMETLKYLATSRNITVSKEQIVHMLLQGNAMIN